MEKVDRTLAFVVDNGERVVEKFTLNYPQYKAVMRLVPIRFHSLRDSPPHAKRCVTETLHVVKGLDSEIYITCSNIGLPIQLVAEDMAQWTFIGKVMDRLISMPNLQKRYNHMLI